MIAQRFAGSLLPVVLLLGASGCATGATDLDDGGGANAGGGGEGAGTTSVTSCTEGTLCDGACVDLETDPQNCGSCGRTCVIPNGTAGCASGECSLTDCAQGFADCDGEAETGCELEDACQAGGACATACGSTGGLVCTDPCAPTCAVPAEACNAIDDDCDGACDQGPIANCRIGVHRASNGTNGHLFTTDLAEAQAWGTVEAENFFYLYKDAAADLRPFFRCPKAGTGNFFLTDSTDFPSVGTVGFIAPQPANGGAPTCGAVPLYRLYLAPNNWHFYTISAAERDNAVVNLGWTDEGIAGYVWTSP
ncbi:MAG: hypothetical protein HOW73_37785 [Polyangiaceae bacterium]|nr:hypothetical protein [Polyangiaceae bacterium]